MKHGTVKVGSAELMVQEFGARTKGKLLAKLGRVIAPALSKAPVEITDETDVADVAPGLAALFQSLDDKAQDELYLAILCQSQMIAEGKAVGLDSLEKIDRMVGADLGLLMRLCWAVLEFNFGDFSAGLRDSALGKVLRAAMANGASLST